MALPTIIIATRSSLKAVPPSIREAALAVGASSRDGVPPRPAAGHARRHDRRDHRLAHALGETAPLLMIGMVAFVAACPTAPLISATALPVAGLSSGRTLGARLPRTNQRRDPRASGCLHVHEWAAIVLRRAWSGDGDRGLFRITLRREDGVRRFARKRLPGEDLGPGRLRLLRRQAGAVRRVARHRPQTVTAMIGPSGCGKSTFLRCMNRMNDTIDGCRVTGEIMMDGEDINDTASTWCCCAPGSAWCSRSRTPFPSPSMRTSPTGRASTASRRQGRAGRDRRRACERAGLWDEVKDRLHQPGTGLSGGQQQRLCIARTIAVNPEVILMDEPCSALDPIATAKIEELIDELRQNSASSSSPTRCSRPRGCRSARPSSTWATWSRSGATEPIFTNPSARARRTTSPAGSADGRVG